MSFEKAKYLIERVSERAYDFRYGIKTRGYITTQALGYPEGDGRMDYEPLAYGVAKKMLSTVTPDPQRDVFIDWGSGLGRVLVLASTYPYREVIGVEVSSQLCAGAERNLWHNRARRRCGSVRIVNADARDFAVPDDSTVMFFFNPFRGEPLTEVVRHIHESWIANPRSITFLAVNQRQLIENTGSADWLCKVVQFRERMSPCIFRSRDICVPADEQYGTSNPQLEVKCEAPGAGG